MCIDGACISARFGHETRIFFDHTPLTFPRPRLTVSSPLHHGKAARDGASNTAAHLARTPTRKEGAHVSRKFFYRIRRQRPCLYLTTNPTPTGRAAPHPPAATPAAAAAHPPCHQRNRA